MKKYIILADMTCDLSEEIRNEIGMIDYVPGHVYMGEGKDIPGVLSWDDISRTDFYKALSNKKSNFSTAPANVEEYYEIFEKYVKEGYAILSMSLSSKISSTHDFASMAANRIKENYPDSSIYCFDTFRMSGGFGLLTLYAHLLKKEGKSFEEVIAWLEDNKRKVHQMGPIDDLFFVARRGRLTMGKAVMGSFAGVKPMGDCNADGYTTVITKVKGIGKALDVTVSYMKETAVDVENSYVIVAHSDRELYAETLKKKIEEEVKPKKVFFTDVFPGCGVNIGPGMVGVFYLGNEISQDLSYEKEIMNRITGK
ncbi:MAG: DegV family EDD domain-containing protein [Ruminococcaceae bacterium]|nr:DegV family EDD domain-containing protein [Oscillospiraceae bacterium]